MDGSSPHLLDWNHELTIGQPFAADRQGREVEAHVRLDRSFAGPNDALSATIGVARVEDHVAVSPDKMVARVEAYLGDKLGWQSAGEIASVPVGSEWVARFAPARPARLVVRVELGAFSAELPLTFRYAAAEALRVIGKTRDRIESGSLAVHFDVDIRHAQPTLVQAVLYDAAAAHPISTFSDWIRPTATGRQDITVRFFGKVIRDQGIAGPYRIMQLHGVVQVPDAQPLEVWWGSPDDPPVMTGNYAPTAFSADEYDSPEKRDTIAHYEDLIRNPPQ
jgi:hypothetical protein